MINNQNSTFNSFYPVNITTLVDILCHRSLHQPDQKAFIFLQDGEIESDSLTYKQLEQQAQAIAIQLQSLNATDSCALLVYPPGLEFIAAFFGCLYARVVAVPVYPPRRNQKISRLQAIIDDSQAKIILTTKELLINIENHFAEHDLALTRFNCITTDNIATNQVKTWYKPAINSETLAFLQYTSGSTGMPKGVMVSHRNLLQNSEYIKQAFELTQDSVSVTWLPSFHDMGLIDGILQPLYTGFLGVLMPPTAFVQQPIRWLKAISHYKANHSGSPNFGYELCVKNTTPEQQKNLDLSRWCSAYSGAEPVRKETLERFADTFRPYGFSLSSFYPCYGMAESTLMISGGTVKNEPIYCAVEADALEQNRVVKTSFNKQNTRHLVGCGGSWLDTKIVIADPESLTQCPSNQIGEIWVSGSSVTQGYWNRPEQTQQTFQAYLVDTGEGHFLRTGDLGFLLDGELFITGRLKDLIIILGRNHYPQDIEQTVEQCHPALRVNCGAAFSVDINGEEKLVIAQEIERTYLRKLNASEVIEAIRQAVAQQHDLEIYAVLLLKTATLPKTSSGKLQRSACRAGFLSGSLDIVADWCANPQNKTKFRDLQTQVESLLQQVQITTLPLSLESKNSHQTAIPEKSFSQQEIAAWLISKVAQELQLVPENIDIRQPLADYGLSSLKIVRFSGELQEFIGRQLSPDIFYDYPSIEALSQFLGAKTPIDQREIPNTTTLRQTQTEAIAIIGIGCRFPGANEPESFWQLLHDGVDAIQQVPASRWNIDAFYHPTSTYPGKMNTRWGGFLEQVDRFEPEFFGVSPREAETMDPQQRLLLEVSWEALENAGQIPEQLAGSKTGVFIGISNYDYSRLLSDHAASTDAYYGTGNALSIAANRLSYLLDLQGPSWAVDTACSSSLVAVHQACQSLRQEECQLAIAGGVNLILSPQLTITFSQTRMMAGDGRCKTFDSSADGYVRGEGCGVVILKRLSDAIANGDNILALIKGSAVNQDGRSNGLTAPNGHAQQAVISQALANANVTPAEIDYVEAHGTGTLLGDTIELNSLKAVLIPGRSPEQNCRIGSVKTNIGHLEAAAGIAGLIKVALSLHHGEIPPHLHLRNLNPHISLKDMPLSIATEPQLWPRGTQRRLAGVSSFGFGGTNAHVILEEAPALPAIKTDIERPKHLLTLSAKNQQALRELAQNYAVYLSNNPGASLADICFTANTGRSHFDHRLATIAQTKEQLHQALSAFTAEEQTVDLNSKHINSNKQPKIVFLFTGQGSQYIDMGRQLYETQPTFRACLDRCNEILLPYLEQPLLSVLYPESALAKLTEDIASPLDQTAYTQPALFALEYALAKLWQSWGIEPAAVMGHSIGEYVAACVAGVFSLEDGLKLISERARLMQALPPLGEMVAVFGTEAEVTAAIQFYPHEVSIAAINAPENIVISGMYEAVEAVIFTLESQGIETRRLNVSHAFHSSLMEPMLDVFEQQASQIKFQSPRIPIVSNLTGKFLLPEDIPDANYWRRHTRNPVRFMAGINTLLAQSYEIFLEIGPKPILSILSKRCQQQENAVWLPSLAAGKNDWQILLESLSTLYLEGVKINWSGFEQDYSRSLLSLPTYPFQRKRYWFEAQDVMNTQITTNGFKSPVAVPAKSEQRQTTLQTLRSLVAKLLKSEPSNINVQAPFLEMGADSIVLVDAVRTIENTYGIKISIRQLFEELTTLDALARYVEENTKSESVAAEDVQEELRSPETKTPPKTVVEEIIQQQLSLMSQQLQVLQGGGLSAANFVPSNNGHSKSASQTTPIISKQAAKTTPASAPSKSSSPLPPWRVAEIRARGLNPQQQRHLEDLIDCYTKRTPTSKQLAQSYRPVLADNRASAGFRFSTKEMLYPIVGDRSSGSRIWDVDGNEYIDITMGFGVNLFGHHPDFIAAALEVQIKQGIQIGPQTRLAGEVAHLICELTGLERVNFSNSGTEAVMTALRLARTATGRTKIAMFAGSYHGHFDGVLGIAQADENPNAIPIAPGITPKTVEDILILEYGNPQSLEIIQAHAQELAAVLVEPVQSRRPDLQPQEFLHQLRRLTRETGIVLIFDEMITGFRIHPGGAQAWFGIDADIATYGKIVGGGMPIGVVAGKAVYMDGIDGGMWNYGDASYPQADTTFFAGTFCKHPLAMATARAVLTHIKQCGAVVQQQLNQRTDQLARKLNAYFEAENLPIRIINFGSLFRFSFLENADLLFYHLMNKGIYIWEGRNCFLSTAHTDEDINYLIQAVKESVEELRSGSFFPDKPAKSSSKVSNDTKAVSQDVKIVPLTEAQKQLWILAQIGEDSSLAYNVTLSVQLKGVFHLEVMRQAVQKLVDRHEALRTTISTKGDLQQILPSLKTDVSLIDFSNFDKNELRIAEWFQNESLTAFDLSNGPLFRVHILKLQEQLHLLVMTAHHIIVDGWSMDVILKDLAVFYRSEDCQLRSPMQFQEYVKWQEQQVHSEEMAVHESYWLEKFASSIPVLDLPTDRPRPPVKTYQGNRQTIQLDANLYRQIKQLSISKGCTLFMTLLAAYTVLLHRLTGHDDIVVGIPVAGRSLQGSERLVGYCTHLLPLRSGINKDATFIEHLVNSRSVLLSAYEHQDYPFALLINKLKRDRDASQFSIVNTTFNLDRPATLTSLFDLEPSLFDHPISFTGSDLSFDVIETNGCLEVRCDYNLDLFNATTIERLLANFQTLLTSIVINPEQRISELPLLSSLERHKLLIEWNQTQKPYSQDKLIHELFEAQVELTPEALAVVFEEQQLTYQALNEQANQVAQILISKGIGLGSYVPVLMDRSIGLVVAMLAVMKTGAAFSPLDINWPIERLKQTLEDLNCQVVLVNETTPYQEEALAWPCLFVNGLASHKSTPNPNIRIDPSNPIYVIYTSGSTGKPKGAVVPHRGIINRFLWMNDFFGCESAIAALQTTHHTYDSAVWQLFWPLINGGKTVLPSPNMGITADNLTALIEKHGVTITDFVPSVFNTLLPQLVAENQVRQKLSSLRTVILGGEEITPETTHTFRQHFPTVQVVNLYGPTEASIGCICYQVTGKEGNKIPIGKAIANVHVLILDAQRNLVPIGVPGEIYLSGICLGLGYLNDELKTQAVFVDNPFPEIAYDKLYKTGDLARYLPDGNIEFLGRIDHQIKIRGFRIELGEIEVTLIQHPGVQETVVTAQQDHLGNKRLVAYVVPTQQITSSNELRAYLKTKLPEYMVPSVFVMLEAIPLMASGKVNRQALPIPNFSQRELETSVVLPRNSIENTLVNLWKEVLEVEQVGIHDNFFELGGDSILSIQIVARANQLGLHLTPKQVFQQQTIAELATVVSTSTAIQAEQGLVTGSVPLTPIQHRFFEQNLSEAHYYNQSVLLEVLPNIQTDILKQVVQQLLIHHDGLRLRYTVSESGWQQINTLLNQTIPFTVIDLSAVAADQQFSVLESTANVLQASLNLSKGPIIQVALFHFGINKPSRLLIVIHHLAVDAVSWRILLEDFARAYQQLSRGEAVQLPPKTTAFRDWAKQLVEYGQSEALATELDYWLEESRLNIAPLPVDYSSDKQSNTVGSIDQVAIALSVEQTQALLQEVPQAYNTQINDILLTALLQSFAQWTGKRSLLVDLEGHGREELFENVDLSRTVGWFTTLFPVLLELETSDRPGETLKLVKEQLRRLPNRGIGYGILRYLSQDVVTRSKLKYFPQAEISFNYLGQLDRGLWESPLLGFAKEASGATNSLLAKRAHLLEVDGFITSERLQVNWTYSQNIHKRETVERLSQGFKTALVSLITHCQSSQTKGYTPSDFAGARIDQKQLDAFLGKIRQNGKR
ncbi:MULTISPECIES: non-ribosomal peptide synthetase/type I polyketide synthase [unclassified Nostoc]|uniref:non-ribosomal peptide synthetase/type I polyketide synthase n=1 Tax=unclassified Nostoc TaxID=2593658 RepID=UPI002AD3BE61|nr:non-ribosomal peptide synthetase/type I polyketide synthase [Nostoc sp. DedQUE03]MDZ7977641.1 amino acid adenylation domain-containing protein [Nostoc sp. DedQUE03]MDZ8049268.1 amino acid adenylation domain-containing protein [Nostoc sp. DedQUE02]